MCHTKICATHFFRMILFFFSFAVSIVGSYLVASHARWRWKQAKKKTICVNDRRVSSLLGSLKFSLENILFFFSTVFFLYFGSSAYFFLLVCSFCVVGIHIATLNMRWSPSTSMDRQEMLSQHAHTQASERPRPRIGYSLVLCIICESFFPSTTVISMNGFIRESFCNTRLPYCCAGTSYAIITAGVFCPPIFPHCDFLLLGKALKPSPWHPKILYRFRFGVAEWDIIFVSAFDRSVAGASPFCCCCLLSCDEHIDWHYISDIGYIYLLSACICYVYLVIIPSISSAYNASFDGYFFEGEFYRFFWLSRLSITPTSKS